MKKKTTSTNLGLTNATRGVIYLSVIAVIAICTIMLPELAREEAAGKVNPPSAYPFLIGAWLMSIPVFIAQYQLLKILKYIDENKAFSKLSVVALRKIKYSAVAFSVMIIMMVISVVLSTRGSNPPEDITPVFTIGFVFVSASVVIATFVAILQKLLREAINIKSENDSII